MGRRVLRPEVHRVILYFCHEMTRPDEFRAQANLSEAKVKAEGRPKLKSIGHTSIALYDRPPYFSSRITRGTNSRGSIVTG